MNNFVSRAARRAADRDTPGPFIMFGMLFGVPLLLLINVLGLGLWAQFLVVFGTPAALLILAIRHKEEEEA